MDDIIGDVVVEFIKVLIELLVMFFIGYLIGILLNLIVRKPLMFLALVSFGAALLFLEAAGEGASFWKLSAGGFFTLLATSLLLLGWLNTRSGWAFFINAEHNLNMWVDKRRVRSR